MAVKAANLIFTEKGLLIASPAVMANGDTSAGIDGGVRRAEVSWSVTGTFGVGGSIQLEDSDDGSTWTIVGAAKTAAGKAEAVSAARFFRFNVTAGDGTTALSPILVMHPIRG